MIDPTTVNDLTLEELIREVGILAQAARPISGGYAVLSRAADELTRLSNMVTQFQAAKPRVWPVDPSVASTSWEAGWHAAAEEFARRMNNVQ